MVRKRSYPPWLVWFIASVVVGKSVLSVWPAMYKLPVFPLWIALG